MWVIIATALYYRNDKTELDTEEVTLWTVEVSGETSEMEFPTVIKDLEERTLVTATTTIYPNGSDYICIKTVYAPIEVYMNGTLVYEYGEEGTYPDMFIDPPTDMELVSIIENDGEVEVELRFLSPIERNSLILSSILVGDASDIVTELIRTLGVSVLFGIFLMILAVILFIMAIIVVKMTKQQSGFMWLSLFSLGVGLWVFCENNLVGLLVEQSSVLYVLSFLGLFYISFPILRFSTITLNLHNTLPLEIMRYVLNFSFAVAFILQLTGTVSFAKSMYYFQVLNLINITMIVIFILRDSYKYHNELAIKFKTPMVILLSCGVLEIINYYIVKLDVGNSFFVQIGVMLFIVYSAYLSAIFIYDAFTMQTNSQLMQSELDVMTKQVNSQKQRYHIMKENSVVLRRLRHDLRHQLAVIKNYNEKGENQKLDLYIDTLIENIPVERSITFCKNEAVNSVIQYYYNMAKSKGIDNIKIRANIPEIVENVNDTDLCIIIGNMMDNAIEACQDMKDGYIEMYGKEVNGFIVITMENSYTSVNKQGENKFVSTKANGGIGLSSIKAVTEKYKGSCNFQAVDGIFTSLVTLCVLM